MPTVPVDVPRYFNVVWAITGASKSLQLRPPKGKKWTLETVRFGFQASSEVGARVIRCWQKDKDGANYSSIFSINDGVADDDFYVVVGQSAPPAGIIQADYYYIPTKIVLASGSWINIGATVDEGDKLTIRGLIKEEIDWRIPGE